jgi:ABC-type lipoprotein export system ATPase subunit
MRTGKAPSAWRGPVLQQRDPVSRVRVGDLFAQREDRVADETGDRRSEDPATRADHPRRFFQTEQADVGKLATALPGELSGGEVQRAALARALVTGPQVVFADEPTGALDTVGGEGLLEVLLSTARDRDASVVLVTHDNRVAAHADREVVLVDGAFTLTGVRS